MSSPSEESKSTPTTIPSVQNISSLATTSTPSETVAPVSTPPAASPTPSAPPRKKRRAPPPPVPSSAQITPPTQQVSTGPPTTSQSNVTSPTTPTPVITIALPPTVPPPVPASTVQPTEVTPTAPPPPQPPVTLPTTQSPPSTVTPTPPPTTVPAAAPTIVQNPSPSITTTVTTTIVAKIVAPAPPLPAAAPRQNVGQGIATPVKPTPPLPVSAPPATPQNVGPTISTTVPSTLPISTKAPPVPPTSPNAIASYLSLASVALGKIPSAPLPNIIPAPTATAAPAQPILADTSGKRQNLVGFADGNWYKIRNVGDNSVVQLDQDGIKFICMEENDDKSEFQLFRAMEQPNGSYRIMSKMQKSTDSIQVWDYLPHRGLLHQKKQSEKTDKYQQNWKSVAVLNFNSLYLIQSGPNSELQHCLKNMGLGEQIKLIVKNEDAASDHFAHWYLELQE